MSTRITYEIDGACSLPEIGLIQPTFANAVSQLCHVNRLVLTREMKLEAARKELTGLVHGRPEPVVFFVGFDERPQGIERWKAQIRRSFFDSQGQFSIEDRWLRIIRLENSHDVASIILALAMSGASFFVMFGGAADDPNAFWGALSAATLTDAMCLLPKQTEILFMNRAFHTESLDFCLMRRSKEDEAGVLAAAATFPRD